MLREFNRDVYTTMQDWKKSCESYKVALVIEGARQVGKTHCIKKFTEANFDNVYYIDLFERDSRKKAESLVDKTLNTQQIIKELFPNFQDGKNNVIIFDEVQELDYIYNLIRPINRGMDCQLIVSGSFLGRILNKGFITPAGDTMHIRMYGLSFPEFLDALGMRKLYDDADLFGGSDPSIYERLRNAFSLYSHIGGYPKVVERFLLTQDPKLVDTIFKQIIHSICEETGRYFGEIQDIAKLNRLLDGVASFLVKEKRSSFKFTSELGRIVQDTNKKSIVNTLHWFWKSGILEPCSRINDCDPNCVIPESLFYFSDIGIANYLYRQSAVHESNIHGVICESFAYSCVRNMDRTTPKEPSFATYGAGELDYLFFVKSDNKIVPVGIEVKGGKSVGNTATKLLKDNKISYLINAKLDTKGGRHANVFTVPLTLLGKFNIFDYIPDDDTISHAKDIKLLEEFLNLPQFNANESNGQ